MKKILISIIFFLISIDLYTEDNSLSQNNNWIRIDDEISYGSLIDFSTRLNNDKNISINFLNINMPIFSKRNNDFFSHLFIGTTLVNYYVEETYQENTYLSLNTYFNVYNYGRESRSIELFDYCYISYKPLNYKQSFEDNKIKLVPKLSIGNDFGLGKYYKFFALILNTEYEVNLNNSDYNKFSIGIKIALLASTPIANF